MYNRSEYHSHRTKEMEHCKFMQNYKKYKVRLTKKIKKKVLTKKQKTKSK